MARGPGGVPGAILQPMKRPTLGLALVLLPALVSCKTVDQLLEREVGRHDAATFHSTTSLRGASFSHDGRHLLVSSDQSGVFNVYSLAVSGGPMVPITHSETDATYAVDWFPQDDRLLFTADQGGNELNHLFVRETDGRTVDLTPGEGLKASFAGWAGDGLSFFVLTNERDPLQFDVYRYEVARPLLIEASTRGEIVGGYRRERIFTNEELWDVGAVGPEGRYVALARINDNADNDLYLFDRKYADEAPVHVTPHEGSVQHRVQTFSPDGDRLFYTSDAGSEFQRVWSYDLLTREHRLVYEDEWDVSYYQYSRDGRYVVIGVNADASTRLRVLEADTRREVALPRLPEGDLFDVEIQDGGDKVAFYVNGDRSPSNLFILDLDSGNFAKLTETLDVRIDPRDLVASEVVRYPSFDGLEIPALLYRPLGAEPETPAPALVWVHGGPGGQSRTGYRATIQHLVNQGYAVLAVNNRGSSGYGKSFYHLDDRKHGDVDLKDCLWARRWLEGLDWVDGERVGIIGGSYGGYMVCAALAFEPEAFDVGVNIFGVTNWVRTLESIPPWWAGFRSSLYAELGDPEVDRERLLERSPLVHAKNIVRPLLVIQGANDPRVLQVESDELVEAVRKSGVPVEYIVFPDEGHGFEHRRNQITAAVAYSNFLDVHLRGVVAR